MITGKTRMMSGLLAVLMVVSLLGAFVLPVTAEPEPQPQTVPAALPEDVVSKTGLRDVSNLPDIVEYEEPDFNEKMRASVRYGGFSGNYPAFDIGDHDFDCNGLQLICVERMAKVLGNKFDNPKFLFVD